VAGTIPDLLRREARIRPVAPLRDAAEHRTGTPGKRSLDSGDVVDFVAFSLGDVGG
jgi:hypothetical protein